MNRGQRGWCQANGPSWFGRTDRTRLAAASRSGHGAFTLLEVLLATGLSLILMVAVYGALELYYRYSQVGQTEMERARIARAVLDMIASDIRSVVFFKKQTSGDRYVSLEETSEEGEFSLEFETPEPTDALAAASGGISGDSQMLVIHVARLEPAELAEAASDVAPMAASELQTVSYFLVGTDSDTALQQAVVAAWSEQTGAEPSSVTGLARLQADRLETAQAEQEGGYDSLAGGARVLAEEIDFLQFEYFDGTQWLEEWDSEAYGGLPVAVAVTIGFRQPEQPPSLLFGGVVSHSTDQYRLVVAVPLAAAYGAESSESAQAGETLF